MSYRKSLRHPILEKSKLKPLCDKYASFPIFIRNLLFTGDHAIISP